MGFQDELGENLRNARMDAGLRQHDLAQQIGVSESCVSQYENGKRMPNLRTASIMSDVLDRSLDDLVPHVEHDMPYDPSQTSIYDVLGDES